MSARPPRATYRLQLTPSFNFDRAVEAVDYLAHLGVSHLYLSPVFEAILGSLHGYNVTDPTRLRAELGGDAGFAALCGRARSRGLGIVLDIVPNHMAADWANPFWRDVLRLGRASAWSSWFDIDWDRGDGKVILPVLGSPADRELDDGHLVASQRNSEPVLEYFGRAFPLAPGTNPAPSSREGLRACLEQQHYRLLSWKEGSPGYRRFFDINDLIGVRVEDGSVFEATHVLVRRLVEEKLADGIRVDHVDGLADPQEYLDRLRRLVGPGTLLVVEKVLGPGEHVRPSWPVDGTTGYEFLNACTRLFVDPAGFGAIEKSWRTRTGNTEPFGDQALTAKREAAHALFGTELERLAQLLVTIGTSRGTELEVPEAHEAIADLTARLGVYRTYMKDEGPDSLDLEALNTPLATADESRHRAATVLRNVLLSAAGSQEERSFIRLWQQFSGPVAAKGVEDTALYRHTALVALNEVGGEPEIHASDPRPAFDELCRSRAQRCPRSMNATATHDTKRGEDTRLRIAALTELSDEWIEACKRWMGGHAALRRALATGPSPRVEDEILAYQTLLGIWPEDGDLSRVATRAGEYLVKAAREAKVRTSWRTPDDEYEQGLRRFAEVLAAGRKGEPFRREAEDLRRRAALLGMLSTLAQVVLKAGAPGTPDFYQGTEMSDLSMVDPDNRREVDFRGLVRSLDSLPDSTRLDSLIDSWPDGRIKQFVTWRALAARRSHAFTGEYLPLSTTGALADRVMAFARRKHGSWAVIVAGCRLGPLTRGGRQWPRKDAWGDTAVRLDQDMPREWLDAITDRRPMRSESGSLMLREVLGQLPAAILLPLSDRAAKGPAP